MLWIDHVILGVTDLDAAADGLRDRAGLDSYAGGTHQEWGTGNRIVPLGRDYLEILGVVDPEVAAGTPFGRALSHYVAGGDRFVGWCLGTDDLEAVTSRLGLHAVHGERVRPDETVLRWRTVGLEDAQLDRSLPFFIAWDIPDELHPARTEVRHGIRPAGIAWVEVSGDPDRLEEWLGGEGVPVRVAPGEPGIRAVGIAADDGELVLP